MFYDMNMNWKFSAKYKMYFLDFFFKKSIVVATQNVWNVDNFYYVFFSSMSCSALWKFVLSYRTIRLILFVTLCIICALPLFQSVARSRYEMKYRRSWITNETMKTGEKRGYYNQTQKGNVLFYIQKSVKPNSVQSRTRTNKWNPK